MTPVSNVVIVALPEEMDEVWKISSEKVPHMTLLFLGDSGAVDNVDGIVKFVEHASTLMTPFWMETDYRGTLGPDQADVLFFEKGWDFKQVAQFRDRLLQYRPIKNAYNSTIQYEEWTPHLTLGYPTSPAKESDHETRLMSVRFDRIAVWTDNYDGPEFRLKRPEMTDDAWPAMSMSAAEAEALYHYGVKGMKWGIRQHRETQLRKGANKLRSDATKIENSKIGIKSLKDRNAKQHRKQADLMEARANKIKAQREAKQSGKADKKLKKEEKAYVKEALSPRTFIDVHNAAADHFNSRIGALNDKHGEFTPKDYGDPSNYSPRYKSYLADARKLTVDSVNQANKQIMPNASKTLQARAIVEPDTGTFHIVVERTGSVKHAATDAVTFNVKFVFDSSGKIIGVEYSLPAIAQGEEFVDGLMHYGVKGMKWGIRKETTSTSDRALKPTPGGMKGRVEAVKQARASAKAESMKPKPVVVTPGVNSKGKAAIKTEGGKNQPPHPDAIKAATTKQQLNESGIKSLSNKELQDLAQRLNLEQQVNRLAPQPQTFSQKAIKKIMNDPVKALNETNKAVENGQKFVKFAKAKKIAKAAAVAATL